MCCLAILGKMYGKTGPQARLKDGGLLCELCRTIH